MKISEAIKWIDNRMCWGRGQWTEHHQPIIDEPWQAGRMAIEALKATQWIPCSEGLPEKEGVYLVTISTMHFKAFCRYVLALYFNPKTKPNWFVYQNDEVIAWMPLPDPWKGEDYAKEGI